ncbi:gamma carbonic anhydrase family protein [Candidatus Amarolinea aalborgensis]|uniref:gamma carbonic anhydrase family protein n=1 Tax=Candidatus Amarolinea aalborgensis TaxID=2249329 RepID=UPI003BF95240
MLDLLFHPELIHRSVFVAPGAVITGQVTMGPESSVWFGCVLRGDVNTITIGAQCNIQDGSILHVDGNKPLRLGDRVSLGHGAIVHGCTVEDDVLIGIRATVLSGAVIGRGSLIGAGAVVPEGMVAPPDSLVLGVPAKVVRQVSAEQAAMIRRIAQAYVKYSRAYLAGRTAPSAQGMQA